MSRPEAKSSGCTLGRCDGRGWVESEDGGVEACECRERRRHRARTRGVSSVIPPRFRGVGFDRPPVSGMDRGVLRAVRRFTDDIEGNLDAGRGMWLTGDVGTGKTTLAMLVSRLSIESGRSVAIYSAPSLLARIRRTFDGQPGQDSYLEFFERLASVDLLHLDDLGAERRTDWVLEQLYALINERYERERSILFTTNLPESELKDQIGERTVSRLVEMCGPDPIVIHGHDHRIVAPLKLPPEEHGAAESLGLKAS